MVVKSQIKFIKSLQQKKCRIQNGMFVAEGIKIVQELLNSNIKAHRIYCTDLEILDDITDNVQQVSESDLKKMSSLKTPSAILGVFYIPKQGEIDCTDWVVALDDIRDPGNLGTIIRLCDWFGIHSLVCSPYTVDCYNPKVLQATMGSIARINIVYTDISDFIKRSKMPVYGAFMDGLNIYSENLQKKGILIMGNEAKGISQELEVVTDKKVSIPQFGANSTESLNVASATAIILNEIRRR